MRWILQPCPVSSSKAGEQAGDKSAGSLHSASNLLISLAWLPVALTAAPQIAY